MTELEEGDAGSRVLWKLVGLAVRVFYRVERVGPPLPDGPLLLVANHPNTLLDPSLVQATAGRPVRFLAKSTLFHGQFLSPIIRRSGAIPVYRKIDPGVDTTRNRETFVAVQRALADSHAICLFPEGVSHGSGRLEPLRSGAARMALTSGVAGYPVTIVPVGLNFDRLPMFRSRVLAVFGQPFDAADLVEEFQRSPHDASRALTERITDRLRGLMIEADPRAELPLVARIDGLYSAARGVSRIPAERLRRRRLIASGMERLRADNPTHYDAILEDLRLYDEQLKAFGLRERDLDRRMPTSQVIRFLLLEGLRAVVLAPLALLGVLCFAPPYWLTWAISRRAPDRQSRATWQVVGGVVVYGVWIAALATSAGLWLGTYTGIGVAVVLPIVAFVGLAAFEREASVVKLVRAFLASRQTPLRARARLKRQRAAIATVLDQVKEWLDTQEPAGGHSTDASPRPGRGSNSY
jgi:1-acyl-sn-glycerol-3-phosphate acyltransferase